MCIGELYLSVDTETETNSIMDMDGGASMSVVEEGALFEQHYQAISTSSFHSWCWIVIHFHHDGLAFISEADRPPTPAPPGHISSQVLEDCRGR